MSSDQGNFQGNSGAGYESTMSGGQDSMGGGAGAMGSGVAGGHGGQSGQEKQDWLDKGIEKAGNAMGVNISNSNADKAGDFANKQFGKKEGFNLPGVQ